MFEVMRFKYYILLLLIAISANNAFSNENEEIEYLKIYYKEWKFLGKTEYLKRHEISNEILLKTTSVELKGYYGDSILITPLDFPNLVNIKISNGNLFALKGISNFKKLESIEINLHTTDVCRPYNTNFSEIYNCLKLKRLHINVSYFPIEISPKIINLKKLKDVYIPNILNPEVIIKHPNWQNFNVGNRDEGGLICYIINCKLANIPLNRINERANNINYNFSLDSSFTISFKDGKVACSGQFLNGKRFGTWKYYNYYMEGHIFSLTQSIYSNTGKLIDYQYSYYNDSIPGKVSTIKKVHFSPKNNETYFKITSTNNYYKRILNGINDTSIINVDTLFKSTNEYLYDSLSNCYAVLYSDRYYIIDLNNNMGYSLEIENNKIIGGSLSRTYKEDSQFYFKIENDEIKCLYGMNCDDRFYYEILKSNSQKLQLQIAKFQELEKRLDSLKI